MARPKGPPVETRSINETAKTSPRGRDSRTGEFVKVSEANRRPSTTTVERVPKPGYGDTGKKK